MSFQVVMKFSDGTVEQDDELFDTADEANEYGLTQVSNYRAGAEVLHASNPGDNPLDGDEEVDFEVVEVDD
ncbi:TPA: hypothetical protein IYE65_002920 [Enterococcus faecium]|nr:hypothetical protein [Enterococcus faecium]HAQ9631259.1 hypothetical protein [Enterococcus faecium]HAQ9640109.1 hypothetical protein [Enterococcus faecium]